MLKYFYLCFLVNEKVYLYLRNQVSLALLISSESGISKDPATQRQYTFLTDETLQHMQQQPEQMDKYWSKYESEMAIQSKWCHWTHMYGGEKR